MQLITKNTVINSLQGENGEIDHQFESLNGTCYLSKLTLLW
jgi:hypothetical protein